MTISTPQRNPPAAAALQLGGAKNAEDALFSYLGGLDVAGERVDVADRFGGVRIFDLAGEYQGLISAGEIGYITDVKVGPDGTVYIADAALHQITMFNADLDLLGGFGAAGPGEGEIGPNSPAALAVSSNGEVFVLDPNEDAMAVSGCVRWCSAQPATSCAASRPSRFGRRGNGCGSRRHPVHREPAGLRG